jgi:hypothetical protein
MTEGFPFLDDSPGDNGGPLATWQPGPGYQPPPRPFTDQTARSGASRPRRAGQRVRRAARGR